MTIAAANLKIDPPKLPVLVLFLILAAVMLGFALYPRDPDFQFSPLMADRPVVMPDGGQLYVQKFEVSVLEWNRCHDAGACSFALVIKNDENPENTPATGLSYVDAVEFVEWIKVETGQSYRLPRVAEWEYMAQDVLPEPPDPIFKDVELTWASSYLMDPQISRRLRPQGTFATTHHGIADLNGNVWEWTSDCYSGATNGDLYLSDCPAFMVAGEHIAAMSFLVRDPARGGCAVGSPPAHLGMRLVLDKEN